eukprot:45048_1
MVSTQSGEFLNSSKNGRDLHKTQLGGYVSKLPEIFESLSHQTMSPRRSSGGRTAILGKSISSTRLRPFMKKSASSSMWNSKSQKHLASRMRFSAPEIPSSSVPESALTSRAGYMSRWRRDAQTEAARGSQTERRSCRTCRKSASVPAFSPPSTAASHVRGGQVHTGQSGHGGREHSRGVSSHASSGGIESPVRSLTSRQKSPKTRLSTSES